MLDYLKPPGSPTSLSLSKDQPATPADFLRQQLAEAAKRRGLGETRATDPVGKLALNLTGRRQSTNIEDKRVGYNTSGLPSRVPQRSEPPSLTNRQERDKEFDPFNPDKRPTSMRHW